ncbi:MAG: hypothetical protein KAI25_00955, partial [Hyphomicrobiaceae bacterium]|nr:hypothetical protein [Hyphomicrobiaceae bacterium]
RGHRRFDGSGRTFSPMLKVNKGVSTRDYVTGNNSARRGAGHYPDLISTVAPILPSDRSHCQSPTGTSCVTSGLLIAR